MKYQIQHRTRRYKDRPLQPWQNPWVDEIKDVTVLFGPVEVVVRSDDLEELKRSMDYLMAHSSGMVDHRIISVIDESGIFPPC